MRSADPSKAYRVLEAGPITLVTTATPTAHNVMTLGFHMMVQYEPPLIACVIGPWDHSYKALQASSECVIAVPGADLARKVVDIGNCSGSKIDKFKKFRLKTAVASLVKAPLIEDCLANIECRVVDNSQVRKYNLFVVQAVALWVNDERKERRTLHHRGDGTFALDGRIIDLRERMVLWKQFQVEL